MACEEFGCFSQVCKLAQQEKQIKQNIADMEARVNTYMDHTNYRLKYYTTAQEHPEELLSIKSELGEFLDALQGPLGGDNENSQYFMSLKDEPVENQAQYLPMLIHTPTLQYKYTELQNDSPHQMLEKAKLNDAVCRTVGDGEGAVTAARKLSKTLVNIHERSRPNQLPEQFKNILRSITRIRDVLNTKRDCDKSNSPLSSNQVGSSIDISIQSYPLTNEACNLTSTTPSNEPLTINTKNKSRADLDENMPQEKIEESTDTVPLNSVPSDVKKGKTLVNETQSFEISSKVLQPQKDSSSSISALQSVTLDEYLNGSVMANEVEVFICEDVIEPASPFKQTDISSTAKEIDKIHSEGDISNTSSSISTSFSESGAGDKQKISEPPNVRWNSVSLEQYLKGNVVESASELVIYEECDSDAQRLVQPPMAGKKSVSLEQYLKGNVLESVRELVICEEESTGEISSSKKQFANDVARTEYSLQHNKPHKTPALNLKQAIKTCKEEGVEMECNGADHALIISEPPMTGKRSVGLEHYLKGNVLESVRELVICEEESTDDMSSSKEQFSNDVARTESSLQHNKPHKMPALNLKQAIKTCKEEGVEMECNGADHARIISEPPMTGKRSVGLEHYLKGNILESVCELVICEEESTDEMSSSKQQFGKDVSRTESSSQHDKPALNLKRQIETFAKRNSESREIGQKSVGLEQYLKGNVAESVSELVICEEESKDETCSSKQQLNVSDTESSMLSLLQQDEPEHKLSESEIEENCVEIESNNDVGVVTIELDWGKLKITTQAPACTIESVLIYKSSGNVDVTTEIIKRKDKKLEYLPPTESPTHSNMETSNFTSRYSDTFLTSEATIGNWENKNLSVEFDEMNLKKDGESPLDQTKLMTSKDNLKIDENEQSKKCEVIEEPSVLTRGSESKSSMPQNEETATCSSKVEEIQNLDGKHKLVQIVFNQVNITNEDLTNEDARGGFKENATVSSKNQAENETIAAKPTNEPLSIGTSQLQDKLNENKTTLQLSKTDCVIIEGTTNNSSPPHEDVDHNQLVLENSARIKDAVSGGSKDKENVEPQQSKKLKYRIKSKREARRLKSHSNKAREGKASTCKAPRVKEQIRVVEESRDKECGNKPEQKIESNRYAYIPKCDCSMCSPLSPKLKEIEEIKLSGDARLVGCESRKTHKDACCLGCLYDYLTKKMRCHPANCDCIICRLGSQITCECSHAERSASSTAQDLPTSTISSVISCQNAAVESVSKKLSIIQIPVSNTLSSLSSLQPQTITIGSTTSKKSLSADSLLTKKISIVHMPYGDQRSAVKVSSSTCSIARRLSEQFMEVQSNNPTLVISEVKNSIRMLISAHQSARSKVEDAKNKLETSFLAKQQSCLQLTMSGLKLALLTIQTKCNNTDRMVELMAKKLTSTEDNTIANEVLGKSTTNLPKPPKILTCYSCLCQCDFMPKTIKEILSKSNLNQTPSISNEKSNTRLLKRAHRSSNVNCSCSCVTTVDISTSQKPANNKCRPSYSHSEKFKPRAKVSSSLAVASFKHNLFNKIASKIGDSPVVTVLSNFKLNIINPERFQTNRRDVGRNRPTEHGDSEPRKKPANKKYLPVEKNKELGLIKFDEILHGANEESSIISGQASCENAIERYRNQKYPSSSAESFSCRQKKKKKTKNIPVIVCPMLKCSKSSIRPKYNEQKNWQKPRTSIINKMQAA